MMYDEMVRLWETKTIPEFWKNSWLCPIPKKADNPELKDLRPLRLCEATRKIWVGIILYRLVRFWEKNDSLHQSQHAYTRSSCTDHAVAQVLAALETTEKNVSTCAINSWDFEKAFDKLDQEKFVKLCRMKGIPSHITRWYWSYVRQRRYCVRVGADYSKSCAFHTGVPQGSICGPHVFNLYTTTLTSELSIHEAVGIKHGAYADDFTLWMKLKNEPNHTPEEREEMLRPMQRALDTVEDDMEAFKGKE
jgi:hypothetical protein